MGRWKYAVSVVAAIAIVAVIVPRLPGRRAGEVLAVVPPSRGLMVSAPGRVEGRTETSRIGSAVDGIVERVFVGEGDAVRRDQLVARIFCPEVAQDRGAAKARLDSLLAQRTRLLRGGRPDAKSEASSQLAAAEAAWTKAAKDAGRLSELLAGRVISAAEYDDGVRAEAVARAVRDAARQHISVVEAEPLPEERGRIDADIDEAAAALRLVDARASRCDVRSPVAGVIVRLHRHAGESVSSFNHDTIASIADTSEVRVRAEVDEADVGRIALGAPARITARALGSRTIEGRVVEIGGEMGRRRAAPDDPADKSDRDVLDVVVRVSGRDPALVVGLRVVAVFPESPSKEHQ